MAIPNKATGYGSNIARNVFRVTFSQALSSKPRYEAYDGGYTGDTSNFPATSNNTTTSYPIFVGSAGNSNLPMIALYDCTVSTAHITSTNWFPASAVTGATSKNLLKGTEYYVTCQTSQIGAGASIHFNMQMKIPYDVNPTIKSGFDLTIRYTYTGAAPVLTWAFNDGGTEAAPIWTTMTPGTHGIRHCRAGTVAGGPYLANIPESGQEKTAEGWVTT